MKKALLTKTMLLLCALIAGSSSVWAGGTYNKVTATSQLVAGEEYLIVYEGSNAAACGAISTTSTKYGLSIGVTISSSTISITDQAVVSFVLGGSSGAWTFNVSSNDYLTWSSGNSLNKKTISGNTTLSNNEKWTITISEGVASIANNATSGNDTRYLKYNSSSGSERFACYTTTPNVSLYKKAASTKTASDLALTGAPIALNFDLYNNTAAQAVTYTSSSTGNVTVSGGDGYITTSVNTGTKTITVTPTAQTPDAGPVTITVNQAEDASYDAGSKTFTVAIVNSDPNRAGTQNNPYTVAQARAAIDAGVGVTGVYVQGKISQIDYVNTDAGKKYATYWISADGSTTGAQLEAYQGKFTGNTDFTSADQISTYDQVVITGNLTKYGNTYEFSAGNYIYSRTPDNRTATGLAWSANAMEIEKGTASYILPTLTNPHSVDVSYTITGTDGLASESAGVITLNTNIAGNATVTANFAGDATYKPASVSYTVTVYQVYTVEEVINGTATGDGVYVRGFIVGEYPSSGNSTTAITTSSFTTDANIALADVFSTTATRGTAIPVQLNNNALKTAWGNQTNNGTTMGYKVLIKGKIDSYFSTTGIKPAAEVTAISIPITPAKTYTTLTSKYNLDFTGLSLEAYVVKDNDASDGYVTLTKVDKVPAGTGLVLVKTSGTSFDVPVFDGTGADDVTGNLMAGSATATTAVAANAGYILKDGAFHPSSGGDLPAGKAYLNVAASAPVLLLNFDGDVTGVNEVRGKMEDVRGEMYDLQGRKVAQPTKGLYIVNGKKYVVK